MAGRRVGGTGRSGLANGNAAANASVSMVRSIRRLSVASGRVVVQPASCRHVTGARSSRVDAAAALTWVQAWEFGFGAGVHGHIEADAEQFRGAAGEPVGEVGGVIRGGVDVRVGQAALVGVEAAG